MPTPEEETEPQRGDPEPPTTGETEDRGPEGPGKGNRGEDIPPGALDLDFEPVGAIEEDLANKLEQGGEARKEAQRELEITGGVLEMLEYLESLVDKTTEIEDFGPDHAEARRDFAIVLGRIARTRDFAWITEYGKELYAVGLGMTLYGGPVAYHIAAKMWSAYRDALEQQDLEPNGTA